MSSCDAIGLWYLAIPPWPLSTLREDWSGEHGVLSNFRISQTNCPPSSICWLHLYWLQWELGYSALNRPLPCRWSCFVWCPTTNAHIKGKKKTKTVFIWCDSKLFSAVTFLVLSLEWNHPSHIPRQESEIPSPTWPLQIAHPALP